MVQMFVQVSPRCPAGRSCRGAEPRTLPSAVWTLERVSQPAPSTATPPPPPWSAGRNPAPVWQPDPGSPSSTAPDGDKRHSLLFYHHKLPHTKV